MKKQLMKLAPLYASILLCAGTLSSSLSAQAKNKQEEKQTETSFEYPLGQIQNGKQVQDVKVVFDKEVIPDFNYEYKPPLPTNIKLYDAKGKLLQNMELETANSDSSPYWPELIDLNFDGYSDLSLAISRGTLGEFYEYWLYNPTTSQFEITDIENEEPVNAYVDGKHKQIVSSATTRLAYQSNVAIYRWEGNQLVLADSSAGYYLPVKLNGELLYCEVVTSYDDTNGNIDYSVKIEQLADGSVKLHGSLPLQESDEEYSYRYDACNDDAGVARDLLEYTKVILWQKDADTKEGTLKEKETQAITQWVQSKDEQGKLIDEWCPVIPYVDLDKGVVSTFVLNYPSEQTELKLCRPSLGE